MPAGVAGGVDDVPGVRGVRGRRRRPCTRRPAPGSSASMTPADRALPSRTSTPTRAALRSRISSNLERSTWKAVEVGSGRRGDMAKENCHGFGVAAPAERAATLDGEAGACRPRRRRRGCGRGRARWRQQRLADLVPGERLLLQQQHPVPAHGDDGRGGRACRAAADDDDVEALESFVFSLMSGLTPPAGRAATYAWRPPSSGVRTDDAVVIAGDVDRLVRQRPARLASPVGIGRRASPASAPPAAAASVPATARAASPRRPARTRRRRSSPGRRRSR